MNKPIIIIDPQFDFCDPKAHCPCQCRQGYGTSRCDDQQHADDIDEINVT